jgi:peptide/nickel transport system substrate-binding protein
MGRAMAIGLTLPATGALLAACGSDDDEPTATTASGQATGTSAGDATPTEAVGAATATGETGEPTATGAMTEPSPTSGESEETPDSEATEPSGGTFVDGGDLSMGQAFEEGVSGGHMLEAASWIALVDFTEYGSNFGNVIRFIFEGLAERNPFTFEPVGRLAQAWEIAEDGLTITFFLREGVLWHDGEPFTAADVVATYEYLMNEDLSSPYYTTLTENIASIEQVDEYTVAFTAPVVQAFFFDNIAYQLIGARHVLDTIPPGEFKASAAGIGSDPSLVVGTGPFTLRERIDEDHLTVDRFDDYWNGAAYLDSFTMRYYPDGSAASLALLSGEADFVWEIQLTSLEDLEQNGFRLNRWFFPGQDGIILNHDPERATPLQDKTVRQALYYAMDREEINLAAFEGQCRIEPTMLAPDTPYANPDGVTVRYEYDPERAMALLDEAGWVVGADGIREKDGQRFSVIVRGWATWPPHANTAVVVQEQWRRIGIDAELLLEDFEFDDVGDWDAAVWDQPFGVPPTCFNIYRCDNPNNFGSYCNPEMDALIDEILVELDEARRLELMTEWQNLVLDELPLLPLYFVGGYHATSPRVHNPPNGSILTNTWFAANKLWVEQ